MERIGLTTTVPTEVLLAAGYQPIDLNNIFITSKDYDKYIDRAERDGFPKSSCAWIKGIYGVCMEENISKIVGVMEGDCSNTKVLVEILKLKGVKVYPFSFPHGHQIEDMEKEINQFMDVFNVTLQQVEEIRKRLNRIRDLAKEVDQLTYGDLLVSGFENHLYQVSCSDFNGDEKAFELELQNLIKDIKKRKPNRKRLRLGYMGVPPMTADLYTFVEKHHGQIIYNEVQREFSFPRVQRATNIYQQYYDYTYPYDTAFRIEEIKKQIGIRNLDGMIHYTQAFCHRAMEDIILKDQLNIPILNIEGDRNNTLDARTKLRIEAFLDMLLDLKGANG